MWWQGLCWELCTIRWTHPRYCSWWTAAGCFKWVRYNLKLCLELYRVFNTLKIKIEINLLSVMQVHSETSWSTQETFMEKKKECLSNRIFFIVCVFLCELSRGDFLVGKPCCCWRAGLSWVVTGQVVTVGSLAESACRLWSIENQGKWC